MSFASSVLVVANVIVSIPLKEFAIKGVIARRNICVEHRPYPQARHAAAIVLQDAAAS